MALRFRKRIRLGKYLYWNINWSKKNGITNTASVGQPGASVGVGMEDGNIKVKRGSVGLPGTGIRYETTFGSAKKPVVKQSVSPHMDKQYKTNPIAAVIKFSVAAGVVFLFYRFLMTFIG